MAPPASTSPETSKIPPLRSIVFLGLVITTLSVTILSVLNVRNFIPDFLVTALHLALLATYFSSIMGSTLLVIIDQTDDRAAMIAHFVISATLSFVLCFSKSIERGGFNNFTVRDIDLCLKLIIWTTTCGFLSAVWIHGGVEALKREAKAVPGNLWRFLYE